MSDDPRPEHPQDSERQPGDGQSNAAASTIFVEMMREAAQRRAQRLKTRDLYRRPVDPDEKYATDPTTSTDEPTEPQKPSLLNNEPVHRSESDSIPGPTSLFAAVEPTSPRAPEPPSTPPTEANVPVPPTEHQPEPTATEISSHAEPEPEPPRTVHPRIPVYKPPRPVQPVANSDEPSDEDRAARLQAQRVQRVQRRRARRKQRRASMIGGFLYTLIISIFAAGIAATIFTWFTDPQFFEPEVVSGLRQAEDNVAAAGVPTLMPTPNWLQRVGIVSGHRGPEDDPGAVCPDGLTEAEINFNVATRVVRNLRALGYSVDLLDEFDTRLDNYRAAALVSIHANSCVDYGNNASGFIVAKAAARAEGGPDTQLAECIARYYGEATSLERWFELTADMTDYHSFREVHPMTPAAIIELGFMLADRELLTEEPDMLARAITQGVLCFLEPTIGLGVDEAPTELPLDSATAIVTPEANIPPTGEPANDGG